tara:strand:+ start:305 stop:505 length:201 start_codon:yes stop_codon:yes gene_type:complete
MKDIKIDVDSLNTYKETTETKQIDIVYEVDILQELLDEKHIKYIHQAYALENCIAWIKNSIKELKQ